MRARDPALVAYEISCLAPKPLADRVMRISGMASEITSEVVGGRA